MAVITLTKRKKVPYNNSTKAVQSLKPNKGKGEIERD